jgi:hypothetical protein
MLAPYRRWADGHSVEALSALASSGNVGPCPDNDDMRLWHRHIWGEWERAWGKTSPKSYVLERKCKVCGKTQTQVVR